MAKTVIITRHGESIGNVGARTKDMASIPLSERGMAQAEALATALPQPDVVIVSPFLRAQMTAEAFLKKYPHLAKEEWPSIREHAFLSEIKYADTTPEERKIPRDLFWENCDPYYCDGGSAESFVDYIARAEETIEKIKNHPAQTMILFSHEEFIKLLTFIHDNPELYKQSKESPLALKEFMRLYKTTIEASRIDNGTAIDISHLFL